LTLVRLVELADLAVQHSDDDEHILSLDADLRRVLGPAAAPVVLAAARGRLVLPPIPEPVAPRPPIPGPDASEPAARREANVINLRPVPGATQRVERIPDSAEVIRTLNLTKVYPGMDVPAVDRLNLTVHAGEIFGLLGPNGAGKTTTAGMLTTRVIPTSGKAIVGGIDVVAHPALAKQALGVVTQQNTLDRSLNVWENLYYHGRYFGMSHRASRAAADSLLAKFHLAKWAKAPVFALSGGMAQRLMVARAILHRPSILFMDEPTAGLDPQSRLALWDILSELHAEGQTILLTTHYMEEADQLCNRVAIMDHGKVLALDTPAALKSSLGAETIVTVSAEGDLDALGEILRRDVLGVTQTQRVDSTVLLHVRGASGVLPQVVTAAERGGFAVSDLSVAEPTLETVFIHLTGKELRD
jgi:ABC-2 type transport system ATP-binding protein